MGDQLVTTDPSIMMGKPVIAGTRITVEHILEELAAGTPVQQLVDGHPRLTREAVAAALRFAAQTVRDLRANEAAVQKSA